MVRVSSSAFVLLLFVAAIVVMANTAEYLVRKRREWIVHPKPLKENVDYTQNESVARIHSDFESRSDIMYSLEGIGANEEPYDVFVVNSKTGFIRVTKVLDREEIDTYNLLGIAKYPDGRLAEEHIFIRLKVVDENDNPPVFGVIKAAEVKELSAIGTSVMKITATDADEPGTVNSQTAYSIIDQSPAHDMFSISNEGTVYVKNSSLDRERADKYTLTVKGQDLNGKPGGHSATTTVTIKVLGVNDNPPTLEHEQYEGSIEENTDGVGVMRIKAEDLDLKDTEN